MRVFEGSVIGPGRFLFACGLAGIGLLSLISGDFAYTWQPVPMWVPWRETLAHVSGILLLVCGIGMLVKRTAEPCTLVMALYLLSWVLLLQAPRVAQAPGNVGMWLGLAENLVLFTGGFILYTRLTSIAGDGRIRVATILFGLACLVLGLSHFVYSDVTASMVPSWLPSRMGFALFTGAAHFAAGLGILLGVVPRLAATLEAIMISLFVLLVHVPGVAAAPTGRMQWTMVFVASAQAGAAWILAGSLKAHAATFWPSFSLRRDLQANASRQTR